MSLDALLRDDPAHLAPLEGGRNNEVFAATIDGRRVCLKRYRIDERRRGRREWEALTLLHRALPGLAPEPLAAALETPPERVVMERVDGCPLDATSAALDACAESLRQIHATLSPDMPGAPTRTTIATPEYLAAKLDALLDASPGAPADSLRALWEPWKPNVPTGPPLHPVFTQGDHGLNNLRWDGARLRWIDWEYGGWTDRALDLADMVEHGQSRAIPDTAWETFLDAFPLPAAERQRLALYRRLFALFWASLWLPKTEADHPRFLAQLDRCRRALQRPCRVSGRL